MANASVCRPCARQALDTLRQQRPDMVQVRRMALLARPPRTPAPMPSRRPPRIATPATPHETLVPLLETLTKLKQQGRRPNAAAYVALVRAAADYALSRGTSVPDGSGLDKRAPASLAFQIALAAVRDAEKGGVAVGREVADMLLRFAPVHPEILPSLLLGMPEQGPSAPAFHALAAVAIAEGNLEQLVVLVDRMLEHGVELTRVERATVVSLCCTWGCPRLALDIVRRLEDAERTGYGYPKQLEASAWIDILTSSAEHQYLEGVEAAWERTAAAKAYTPDEGLILSVLSVAGRWGRPELATKALAALGALRVRPGEHHLVPLLEAFCRSGQVPEAIKVLCGLRGSGIAPTLATAQPIVAVLSTASIVDQAFYALEDMHAAGTPLDVAALNAVVEASARLGDLARARATQTAAPALGLQPDVDTFNLVLSACVTERHRALGDTLFTEMAAAGVAPDATTYARMVALCLSQPRYDDAFYYLEKMKAEGHVPPRSVYEALYRKCEASGDARWRPVVDEARGLGYAIRTRGDDGDGGDGEQAGRARRAAPGMSARKTEDREAARERQRGRRRATDQMVGDKRRDWVERHSSKGCETGVGRS